VSDRLGQLFGVTALAAMDRLRVEVGGDADVGELEAGALVHLQAWPGCSLGDLAGVVGRSQPATVRLVDRLVARGLVRRGTGADRRTLALALTDAGARVADAILTARARALAPMLGDLSPREQASLERVLARVAAGIANDWPTAVRACRLCDRRACTSGPGCPLERTIQPGAPRSSGRSVRP
jgi:DNA-binding MarR family transcriptional regulator